MGEFDPNATSKKYFPATPTLYPFIILIYLIKSAAENNQQSTGLKLTEPSLIAKLQN